MAFSPLGLNSDLQFVDTPPPGLCSDPDLMKVCTGEDLDISKVGVVSDACFVLGAKYGGGVSECADLSKDQVTTQCKAALGLPCSPNNQSTPSPTAVCARVRMQNCNSWRPVIKVPLSLFLPLQLPCVCARVLPPDKHARDFS